MADPYFGGNKPSGQVGDFLAKSAKVSTGKTNLGPPVPVKQKSSSLDGNLTGHERLLHAVRRMKSQGNLSDNAIRVQVHLWNPHMSEADILNTLNEASPVKTTYPKGSVGYAQAKLGAHPTYDVAPGLRSNDLQVLHKASQAPIVRTLGNLTNPLTIPIDLGESLAALEKHPGVKTGLGAGLAAASILPVGRLGKLAKAARAAKELKPDEQAALDVVKSGRPIAEHIANAKSPQELSDLHAAAKHVHDVNGVPKIVPTNHKLIEVFQKQHVAEMSKDVRDRLVDAPKLIREQNKLYSAERGVRAGEAAQAMKDESGVAGYQAALGKLKGELPKLKFNGFENFDQNGLDALMTHIQQHPTLRPFEKVRTQGAILNVLNGKVPTKSELKLLHGVFGKDVAERIHESIPFWQRAKTATLETLNVPRSLMSSFDLSAPFRQGLVVGVTHPKLFFKNFAPMVKAFGSENVYRSIMDDIATRPTYGEMKDANLALTDLGSLDTREEQFMSNYAEHIPVVGRAVRASDRAYVGFLNKTRADLFDYLLDSAHQQGISTADKHVLDSIGKFVNSATGRGDLGAFQKHAATLNTLFFSPRLLFSRLNFMNPVYYAKLDPFARKEALKAARNLVATMGLVLYAAKLGGAKVNIDPRNADFAKIRLGNTRIDLAGGFQQPVRLIAQLFSGKIVSSTTGKTLTLGPQGPGKLSRRDIVQRFLEGKLGPVPSIVNDWFKGTDFNDKPFSWKKEAVTHMLPLLSQDANDLRNQEGLGAAVGGYAFGSLGFGLQTYAPQKPKAKGSSSGADPYFGTAPTSGASDPYFGSP